MRWLPIMALAVAGCLGDGIDTPPDADVPSVVPPRPLDTIVEQDHDHADAALHEGAWNVGPVGYNAGYLAGEEPAGGFTELAVHLPYVYICRGGASPGVVTIDAGDVSAPVAIGHFRAPRCDDIDVSADGRWVFAAVQRNDPEELADDGDAPTNLPRGTYVLDATDPAALRFESFYAMPYNGPHTIQYHRYDDGREVVVHCTYDLYSRLDPTGRLPLPAPAGAVPVTQRLLVAEFGTLPDGSAGLETIAAYQETAEALRRPDASIIPHDATFAVNPLDNRTYLLVAYWDEGVHILDATDPEAPVLVGKFQDFAPSAYANMHQVRAFPRLLEGRWVLVGEPEIPTAEETGQITFIDASDPSNPTKLGHWRLPGNLTVPEPFIFSPHNFDVDAEGRVFLGHNHAGLWVISIQGAGTLQEPATTGYYMPLSAGGVVSGGPGTWGVFLRDGLLYASDGPTGLHVLRYGGP